jgi:SAM-dependent methyltransferase
VGRADADKSLDLYAALPLTTSEPAATLSVVVRRSGLNVGGLGIVRKALKLGRLRSLLQLFGDSVFDKLVGMETARPISQEGMGFDADVGFYYQGSNWLNLLILRRMLGSMDISARDVFIDFGCGKGQVLFEAARHPFGRVIGLDVSDDMIRTARDNLARNSKRFRCGQVEFVTADVLQYAIPQDLNVCYFFNPFPPLVLEHVIASIGESVASHPREVRLISLWGKFDDVYLDHGFVEVMAIRKMVLYSNAKLTSRGTVGVPISPEAAVSETAR